VPGVPAAADHQPTTPVVGASALGALRPNMAACTLRRLLTGAWARRPRPLGAAAAWAAQQARMAEEVTAAVGMARMEAPGYAEIGENERGGVDGQGRREGGSSASWYPAARHQHSTAHVSLYHSYIPSLESKLAHPQSLLLTVRSEGFPPSCSPNAAHSSPHPAVSEGCKLSLTPSNHVQHRIQAAGHLQ
jgi:hypothetical protein